jgi:hypothetical protein
MSLSFVIMAGVILAARSELVAADEKVARFELSYDGAGLTKVSIKDGKLHYLWHTRRKDGITRDLGALISYDRHEVDIWLSEAELTQFEDWASRHKIFGFDSNYPSASTPGTVNRGDGFEHVLKIIQADKKHSVIWTGASTLPPTLQTAAADLMSLAKKIKDSRQD